MFKLLSAALFSTFFSCSTAAQDLARVSLPHPNRKKETPLMQALAQRESVRSYTDEMIDDQELSDLLWAANGINRPNNGGRTAPSAINAKDIDLYILKKDGIYKYELCVIVLNRYNREISDADRWAVLYRKSPGKYYSSIRSCPVQTWK